MIVPRMAALGALGAPERLERRFGALTEAELEASGFMERAEGGKAYLGLHGTFYQLAPETEAEDQVTVHETWLRKDGLVVLLKDGLRFNHPPGTKVLLS